MAGIDASRECRSRHTSENPSGFVDHELSVDEMPAALLDYQRHRKRSDGVKGPDGVREDLAAHLSTSCRSAHPQNSPNQGRVAKVGLSSCRPQGCSFCRVIPEIDIWRAANLMLKRYGEKALEESEARADELAAADDYNGVAVWRRIRDAVAQLTNKTPSGPVH
jgi:hypothetical protein